MLEIDRDDQRIFQNLLLVHQERSGQIIPVVGAFVINDCLFFKADVYIFAVSESSQPQYFIEQAVLGSPQHVQRASPSHKPHQAVQGYRVSAPPPPTVSRVSSTLVGERIDPKVPLVKQGYVCYLDLSN